MLQIVVPAGEHFNKVTREFLYNKETVLNLEHSLVSISKWEAKWHKPFLTTKKKTVEETRDYVRCMTLTQNVNPIVYLSLTNENIEAVNAYIDDPMTATVISKKEGASKGGREIITNEVIYSWMIGLQIPVEFQKWHLNRLITLISVCNENNKPKEKMSEKQVMKSNDEINEMRKAQMKTNG